MSNFVSKSFALNSTRAQIITGEKEASSRVLDYQDLRLALEHAKSVEHSLCNNSIRIIMQFDDKSVLIHKIMDPNISYV